jgi:hypothetical protein
MFRLPWRKKKHTFATGVHIGEVQARLAGIRNGIAAYVQIARTSNVLWGISPCLSWISKYLRKLFPYSRRQRSG